MINAEAANVCQRLIFISPISDNTNYSQNPQGEESKQYKIFTYKQLIFCILVPLTNI